MIYLKNRTPTRTLDNKTPYEMVYKKLPDLVHLLEFGVRVWVHNPNSSKLDGRAEVSRIAVEQSVKLDRTTSWFRFQSSYGLRGSRRKTISPRLRI
ncbi:hypothetical protein FB451DRAFT_1205869, partial [Mycena latifolia]